MHIEQKGKGFPPPAPVAAAPLVNARRSFDQGFGPISSIAPTENEKSH